MQRREITKRILKEESLDRAPRMLVAAIGRRRPRSPSRALIATAGLCLIVVLSFSTRSASAAAPADQDMRGAWSGFFQGADNPDIVHVGLEITEQDKRRFVGTLEAGGAKHIIEGAVSASGKVKIQGHATHSHGIVKMELRDFGGGAAILDGSLMLHFADGRMTDGTLLLLRPFTPSGDDVAPLPEDTYRESQYIFGAKSKNEPVQQLQVNAPNLLIFMQGTAPFIGVWVEIGESVEYEYILDGLATTNGDGRFIAIAQSATSRLILDGSWQYLPQSDNTPIITGRYTLELNDRTVDEGTFGVALERSK